MTVEDMRPEDWPACARIFEEGLDLGTFEDAVPSWEAWDEGHLAEPRLVARENGAVVGWAALAPYSSRACYRGVVENSVYVGWAARGRGVGGALLSELVRRAVDRTYRPHSRPAVGGFELSVGVWRRPDAAVAGRRLRYR